MQSIVGRSVALSKVLAELRAASRFDTLPILITGSSGSGKSLLAEFVHESSSRSQGPFVVVNCANLPQHLVESELFGAEAGSHSTALTRRGGKVEAAEGGTLFLDEVAELHVEAQAKLLTLLQAGAYYPLGASEASRADVRVVAATNQDLDRRIRNGRFREDLFHRLHGYPVCVPDLDARPEDIIPLAEHVMLRFATEQRMPALSLDTDAASLLESRAWPGNVRELENVVRRACVRAWTAQVGSMGAIHLGPPASAVEPASLGSATRRFQRRMIERTLNQTQGNVSAAADRLDVARSHLYTLMKRLGLERSMVDSGPCSNV